MPEILKCRNFRRNEPEREGLGLACGPDQNDSTRTPKMDGTRIITKEDHEITGMFGHDPENFQKEVRENGEQLIQ
ncbi:MAG: hypothetical protein WCF88_05785, partial [Candidatus Acidiferrales bacterium]